jgi:hypothetical protein
VHPPPAGGGRNGEVDFRGEKCCNDTHESHTDPDCRHYREGQEAKLCYLNHLMMENRNGFVVEGQVTPASGQAKREAAVAMLEQLPGEGSKTLRAVCMRGAGMRGCGFDNQGRGIDARKGSIQTCSWPCEGHAGLWGTSLV